VVLLCRTGGELVFFAPVAVAFAADDFGVVDEIRSIMAEAVVRSLKTLPQRATGSCHVRIMEACSWRLETS
jgi:hypothetical protein